MKIKPMNIQTTQDDRFHRFVPSTLGLSHTFSCRPSPATPIVTKIARQHHRSFKKNVQSSTVNQLRSVTKNSHLENKKLGNLEVTPMPAVLTARDHPDTSTFRREFTKPTGERPHPITGILSNGTDLKGVHDQKLHRNKKKHCLRDISWKRSSICFILSVFALILFGAGIAAIPIALLGTPSTTTTTITTATTILSCFTTPSPRPTNSWFFVGNMSYSRQFHTATLLSSDNSVFVAGGFNSSGAIISTEIYTPITGCFHQTGNMLRARYKHTANQLSTSSQSVLLAGGLTVSALNFADLFDTSTGNVSTIMMTARRYSHTSVLLNTSSLVLIGGLTINSVNSIDILNTSSASSFTAGPSTMSTPRHAHTTTSLVNLADTFLVAGGLNVWTGLSSAELFNGSSSTFISLASAMSTARFYHAATYVPAVRQVLITGGSSSSNALKTMAIFDVATMSFITPVTTMSNARMYHTATLLGNGQILLIGGSNGTTSLSTCELIDPTNSIYTSTLVASLQIDRYYHTTTLISSYGGDTVLVCGGLNTVLGVLNSCELYFV